MKDGQTIYDYAYHKVKVGADFKVDFILRRVEVDGEVLIENGKWDGELGVGEVLLPGFALATIIDLYAIYRHSTPTERSERKKHTYFYAMSLDELAKTHTVPFGERRDTAQFKLEFTFLCYVLTGQLVWQPDWPGYYWRPSKDSTLRIQREWIEQ